MTKKEVNLDLHDWASRKGSLTDILINQIQRWVAQGEQVFIPLVNIEQVRHYKRLLTARNIPFRVDAKIQLGVMAYEGQRSRRRLCIIAGKQND